MGGTITNKAQGPYLYNAVETPSSNYDPVHSGNYGAAFLENDHLILACFTQTLPTVSIAEEYLLSFWLTPILKAAPVEFFAVSRNTNSATTNTLYSHPAPSVFGWTNLNFVVAATATNAMLQFSEENQPDYFGLDDISVTAIPTPSFSAVSVATNSLALTWNTLATVKYLVQYNTNLSLASWLNLGGAVTAITNTFTLLDTNAFNASPQRFFTASPHRLKRSAAIFSRPERTALIPAACPPAPKNAR